MPRIRQRAVVAGGSCSHPSSRLRNGPGRWGEEARRPGRPGRQAGSLTAGQTLVGFEARYDAEGKVGDRLGIGMPCQFFDQTCHPRCDYSKCMLPCHKRCGALQMEAFIFGFFRLNTCNLSILAWARAVKLVAPVAIVTAILLSGAAQAQTELRLGTAGQRLRPGRSN